MKLDIQQTSALLVKAIFGDPVKKAIESTLTKEVAEVANMHAYIASTTGLLLNPGADAAAFAGNIWLMYARINDKLGIKFSDNLLKSIGSAVVANIASTVVIGSASSLLKVVPVPAAKILGHLVTSGASYKATMLAASIYMHALTRIVGQSGNNISDAALRNAINAELRNK